MSRPRIVHVISGLRPGGAEIMLLEFIKRDQHSQFDPMVVSLAAGGELKPTFEATGVPIVSLELRAAVPDPRAIAQLVRLLRKERPAVVQTWMYHANLAGGVAAGLAGRVPVAWGIHHTNLSPAYIKRSTFQVAKAGALLSRRVPKAIVCCAESSRTVHAGLGYAPERMTVIPNGFDTGRFRPNPAARGELRAELGLAPETPLAGMLARFNPQKDHRNFVRAAAVVAATRPDAHFLLAGFGVTPDNAELTGWIAEAGMAGRIHLVGSRSDTAAVNAGLDVAVLSSESGEAFPLVIGEAMACGTPCAVTDVGDSALIVGELGRVVPPKDPAALGAGILALLALTPAEREQLAVASRRRVVERFDLPRIVDAYEKLWLHLQGGGALDLDQTWSPACA